MSGPGEAGDGWRPDVARMARRIAAQLTEEGAAHPHVGAAALAARGIAGVGLDEFAAELGVEPEALADVEAGLVSVDRVPDALLRRFRLLGLDRPGPAPPPQDCAEG